MKLLSDTTFLKRLLPAVLLAAGITTAASANAGPADNAGVAATALADGAPLCGDIRGRVTMIQFERGETYVLADGNLTLVPHPSTVDPWDANHVNSGN